MKRLLRFTRAEPRALGGRQVVIRSAPGHVRIGKAGTAHRDHLRVSWFAPSTSLHARRRHGRALTAQSLSCTACDGRLLLERHGRAGRGPAPAEVRYRPRWLKGQPGRTRRWTAGNSQRARPSNWRAEGHHARMLQSGHHAPRTSSGPSARFHPHLAPITSNNSFSCVLTGYVPWATRGG